MPNATRSQKHGGSTDAGKSNSSHARAVAKVSYRSVLANKVRFLSKALPWHPKPLPSSPRTVSS